MNTLSLVGNDVYTDLEFFNSFENDDNETIIKVFNEFTPNKSSFDYIKNELLYPIYDIESLKDRQNKLKQIEEIYNNNIDQVESLLQIIKGNENDIISLYKKTENSDVVDIMDMVFFQSKVFNYLNFNNKGSLLTLKNVYNIIVGPSIGIISPIFYILSPYLILKYKFKFKIPIILFIKVLFKTILNVSSTGVNRILFLSLFTYGLSIFIYIQGLINSYELAKNTFKVTKHIVNKMTNVYSYLDACKSLNVLFKNENSKFSNMLAHLSKVKLSFLNFGEKLSHFKKINLIELEEYIQSTNIILSKIVYTKLIKKYDMCYTNFIESNETYISAEQIYHLSIKNAVKNNFSLEANNCIITGPNAAGKSTFMKAIALNIILSQTIGIASANKFDITPFYYINTQINIPDCKGKQSLFEAEMYRCKYNIDIVTTLPKDKKAFILMDEVFNSTNVIEGISGSYAILERMSRLSNVCTLVTTHYLYLAKLKHFSKYKMNVKYIDDNITYPYILNKGISKQLVALELLKENFDNEILDIAINIKNKLINV
jgi:energy-coupling factor transporter ATP-binding protein EcfA2